MTHNPQEDIREQDCFPSPEHLAFARWFADWWLRRGQHLTDPDRGRG